MSIVLFSNIQYQLFFDLQKVTPPKRLASQLKQIKKSYSNEKSTIFKVKSAKTIADHSSTG